MKRMMLFSIVFMAIFLLIPPSALSVDRTGVTGTAVKIGFFAPLTGPASIYGVAAKNVTVMYVDELNKAGGINGRKIELIIENDESTGAKALAATKKLIERDKVFIIFGGCAASATAAAAPYVQEKKVPFHVIMAIADKITIPFNKTTFRTNIPGSIYGRLMADFAADHFQTKRLGIIYQTDEYGMSELSGSTGQAERLKMPIVSKEGYKIGDADFSSQVLKLKEADADAVLLHAYAGPVGTILRQAHELGYKAKFVAGIAGAHPRTIEVAGRDAVIEKFYGVSPLVDVVGDRNPLTKEFVEKYRKAYPEESKRPGIPGVPEFQSLGAVKVFLEGLKRAGRDLSRESYIKAMESIKELETGGYTPISFTETDHDGVRGVYFWVYNKEGKVEFLPKYYKY